jgi:MoCo/4Fe-4S cofactor protein with predicted Tat translocation signal
MEQPEYSEHGLSGKKRSNLPSRPVSPNQWGSLAELANSPEFRKWPDSEFPLGAAEFVDPLARREFMRLMGASLALMAVSGCNRPPQQKIVPYLEQPELLVSGRPLFFATAMPFNGPVTGILVQSDEGRPTKIEGNSSHPLSLGATSIFEQAAILTLYDPDRSKTIIHQGQIETWESFLSAWLPEQDRQLSQGGRTLRFLIDSVTSPTLVWQVGQLQKRYPGAKWYQWEPISQATIIEGYRSILGRPVQPQYWLAEADVIVAFDSDFLFDSPFRLANTRAFAGRRNYRRPDFSNPNRLYVAEPSPTITGSMAELRLPIAARQIGLLVQMLANRLGVGDPGPNVDDPQANAWIDACFTELAAAHGRSVVLAGFRQSPLIHRWIHAINVSRPLVPFSSALGLGNRLFSW